MASQGGTSRLAQMQMRFQQKQQQEREIRKTEMTGSRSVVDCETKSLNSSIGAGKVRQMFDERRQRSTGIDKSYPLKPISGRTTGTANTTTMTTSKTTRKQSTVSTVKQTSTRTSSSETTLITKKANGLNGNAIISSKRIVSARDTVDNGGVLNNNDLELSPANAKIPIKMPSIEKLSLDDNKNVNGYAVEDRNNNKSTGGSTMKLKPVVTKKSAPEPRTLKKTDSKTSSPASSRLMSPAPEKASPTKSTTKTNAKPTTTASSRMAAATQKIPATPAEDMAACRICSRHFNVDRIGKHQQICERTAAKKRRVFDASKYRVKGTEAEKYVKRAVKSSLKVPPPKVVDTSKKPSNWRKKHEEFIQAIRNAKEMQAYLARGGKLSDLPPPTPSENPDYVQCPHCKRRFNEGAAARHIPKCADMLHNKPKPGTQAKKGPTKR